MENEQITLRDTITDLADKAEAGEPIEITKVEPEIESPEQEKQGRTAGRKRDEHGRLLPGKAEKPEPIQTAEVIEPPKPLQRPSSWKKELWGHWDKLSTGQQLTPEEARQIAEYNLTRESDYAKGVSTYKQEWERAKPLIEAIEPHRQMLEQYGINPAQQIDRYMQIHRTLATGSPEQKLGLFMQIAQDYQVPVQNLFIHGQDGQVYLNEQVRNNWQPQQQQPDVAQLVEQKFQQIEVQRSLQSFMEAKDASGNPAHPHYETVRETMAQLLDAGISNDLEGAYNAALRLPQHNDIFEAEQQQQRQKNEAEKARKLKEEADRARRNNFSTKTATPSVKGDAPKGLRGTLEAAFEEHAGRV